MNDSQRPLSALLINKALTHREPTSEVSAILAPFRTYVAAAVAELPVLGDTVCVSMHASPNPLSDADRASWPWPLTSPRGGSRDGKYVRRMGELFYSDAMLEALRLVRRASALPVLAAGDLNEARLWDELNRNETWGSEFFGPALTASGFKDVTWELWSAERRTRFHRTHPHYQLDHFLSSREIPIDSLSAWVDPVWDDTDEFWAERHSDHAPVWLRIHAP